MTLTVITGDKKRTYGCSPGKLHGILQDCGIPFSLPCGGNGSCGGCRIMLKRGEGEYENVLACRTEISEDSTVIIEDKSLGSETAACAAEISEKNSESGYSIAIDIGTTTIAAGIYDPDTDSPGNFELAMNLQRSFGADVISRIGAASNGALEKMTELTRGQLSDVIDRLCTGMGIKRSAVDRMVVAANTTMTHIFMGEDIGSLGRAPFEPGDTSLRKTEFEGIPVTVLPGISAFIGGDIVSGMYALSMDDPDKGTALLMDLGTNGELVIGDGNSFIATSTAAGPAFEGAGISCGMAHAAGAVTAVSMRPIGSGDVINVKCSVFRDAEGREPVPVGICGSGLLSAVSEMLRLEIIDRNGTFQREDHRKKGFCLYKGIGTERDIILTQEDIRCLLVAKAAVRSGLEILLKRWMSESGHKMPERVYLAGGFGDGLDIAAASNIGLMPGELASKCIPVGNTSQLGAERYLRDESEDRLNRIISGCSYINLAGEADFDSIYIEEMRF